MRTLFIILLYVIQVVTIDAQTKFIDVKGDVLSATSRRPLAGATIQALNGKYLIATDAKGRFSIVLSDSIKALKISLIGYKDTVVQLRGTDYPLAIRMEETNRQIEEVVIHTGYQTLRPNEVTGAVETISNKMLNQQTGTNILQRINNTTAGIRFDNQPIANSDVQKLNVSVRGLSTINGNLDPLVVLDGFIYEGDINNIDPNNIESVTILKDAAASAIWGARAGNGVIVMTSKKGTFTSQQRSRISFNSTLISRYKPDLSQRYELGNTDFIKVEEMLYNNGYYDWIVKGVDYISVTPAVAIFDQRRLGLISSLDSAMAIDNLLAQDGKKAYAKHFYRTPVSTQYSLNASGGSSRSNYGLSMGYVGAKDENSVRDEKINLQFIGSVKPIDRLQIDLNILYTHANTMSGTPSYESFSFNGKRVPYLQFTDDTGGDIPYYMYYREMVLQNKYNDGFQDWAYYPLTDYKNTRSTTKRNELYSTLAIRYKLLPILDFSVSMQYQQQGVDKLTTNTKDSYYTRTYINQFTVVNPNNGSVKRNVPLGDIRNEDGVSQSSYTSRGQFNLNKTEGDHHIVGVLGAEIREIKTTGNAFTAYGYNGDPLRSAPVDHVSIFTTHPANLPSRIIGYPTYQNRVNRFVSLYGNGSYIYKRRYAVSGSIRKDGGNIFGAQTNDKWTPLWSVGSSWEVSNERFFDVSFIDQLRLRTTYGWSGNVDLRKTPDPVASSTMGTYTMFPALIIGTLNDPNLRWEKVSTINLGMDFALWKGRVTGAIDYYIKDGRDLYGLTAFDYTGWGRQSRLTKNVARMEGRGWDVTVNTRNIERAVRWDTRYIVNLNRNKTVEYYNTANSGVGSFLGTGNTITPIVGLPLNALAGFTWLGLNDQGDAMGILNGEASTDYLSIHSQSLIQGEDGGSIVFYGSSKPQLFGSIINSFSWKAYSLSFNVSFKGDYYFRKPVTSYFGLFRQGTAFPDFEQRWQSPGDEKVTHVPRMQYPLTSNGDGFYTEAAVNIYRADHLRLEYITASWSKNWQLKNNMLNMRFYGNVANLGLLWTQNKEGIDPDYAYRLRPPVTISLGMQIDF